MKRKISMIRLEIIKDWKKVNYGAKPYLDAMEFLNSIEDNYYADSARTIVSYFLSNARSWTGEVAKRIKKELKEL